MSSRVLITGVSQGLGEALLRQYAERHFEVVAVDRAVIPDNYRASNILFQQLDITDRAAVSAFIQEMASSNRLPDVVIFNAAIHEIDNDPYIDYAALSRVLETNLMSIFHFLSCLMPLLKKPATFVLCSSGVIIFPNPANLGYYLGKLAATKTFDIFNSRYHRQGFRFKSVILGPLRSPMLAQSRPPRNRLVQLAREITTGEIETAATKIVGFAASARTRMYYRLSSAVILWLSRILQSLLPKSFRFYQAGHLPRSTQPPAAVSFPPGA